MISRSHLLVATVALAVGVVATLLWRHDADTRRDGRIATLDSLRTQDSIARVAAEHRADVAASRLSFAVQASARVDTLWRTTTRSVTNTVHDIVHDSSLTDTQKVPLLVAQVTRLQAVGDSMADVNAALRLRAVEDSSARAIEREASHKALRTATEEIALLKKQSRHWGLGVAFGPGLSLQQSGEVKFSRIQLSAGVVYRW